MVKDMTVSIMGTCYDIRFVDEYPERLKLMENRLQKLQRFIRRRNLKSLISRTEEKAELDREARYV